jgi:predicted oxidoreductase
MMKQMTLGSTDVQVSNIALGCMRLSDDRETAMATVQAALDQGINFFDHADIYGGGKREATFSALWERSPHLREQIFVQSKCGIRFAGQPDPEDPARYDFSYDHIVEAVEGSLKRLKTDYLDVLLLHRPDALVAPEEVARAFDELHQAGKVRWFGVSNHTAGQIQLLQTCV